MEYVREIALSTPRLEASIFGAADYTLSLGIPVTNSSRIDEDYPYPGHRWNFALSRMAVAARNAGIQAIDGPFTGFKGEGLEKYRERAEWAAGLGCDGKWAIHPAQVPVAQQAFTPPEAVVARAAKIVDAYDQAQREGIGVISVDGDMIDAVSYKIARGVLMRKG